MKEKNEREREINRGYWVELIELQAVGGLCYSGTYPNERIQNSDFYAPSSLGFIYLGVITSCFIKFFSLRNGLRRPP